MPGDLTLPRLHDVIQAAMGWSNSHLHRFRIGRDHRSPYFVTNFDLEEHYEDFAPRRFDGVKAWIPVQRGCDYRCTYCIVPTTRGPERSRRLADVVREIHEFGGIREIRTYGTGGRLGFPMGNAVGAMHIQRGYRGETAFSFHDPIQSELRGAA